MTRRRSPAVLTSGAGKRGAILPVDAMLAGRERELNAASIPTEVPRRLIIPEGEPDSLTLRRQGIALTASNAQGLIPRRETFLHRDFTTIFPYHSIIK